MPTGNLLTKDDGWTYMNAVILYLAFFPLPSEIVSSSIFVIMTLGISILIDKISSIERLYKLIFKRLLIKSEIKRRRVVPDYDYDELSAEARDEVDKIDDYFLDHAKTFSALLILTTSHLFLIIFQLLRIIPRSTLTLQNYELDIVYLVAFVATVNIILMWESHCEIKRYMLVDLIEVYDIYS